VWWNEAPVVWSVIVSESVVPLYERLALKVRGPLDFAGAGPTLWYYSDR